MHPVQISITFFIVILLFRIKEIFYLRLGEAWGEVFISKLLGFLMILGYLKLSKRKIRDIGIHSSYFVESILINVVAMALILASSYFFEYLYLTLKGLDTTFVITPMSNTLDAEFAVQGGFLFGLWLIFGNLMSSLIEEGLFRGVMMTHFSMRLSFWKANLLLVFLFGLWYIIWPIKSYTLGQ